MLPSYLALNSTNVGRYQDDAMTDEAGRLGENEQKKQHRIVTFLGSAMLIELLELHWKLWVRLACEANRHMK